MSEPFYFFSQAELIQLLGITARNPVELVEGLKRVPTLSIYYHTHKFLQQHHYLSPEPPNDFAYWLTNILNLKELGEAVASVDILIYRNVEDLRNGLLGILHDYLSKGKYVVDAPEGGEFHFMSCKLFVLPTPYVSHNPHEFIEAVRMINYHSLYYHVFEARLRLAEDENDFTAWFKGIGEARIAKELSRLDPYTITLEGLREKIIQVVEKYAGT
ncbi:MAG: DUF5752 family protein [Candidatus Latescibacter sp.]|nr:DUF5752 family protein [Candidatus Latescibacter sp.]